MRQTDGSNLEPTISAPRLASSSEKYGWLNRICSIACGSLSANARTLDVYQVP
jgi:hypothetical protein